MALPGVKTTILDRFYNLPRTDLPQGKLITVVAKRGPVVAATPPISLAPDLIPYQSGSEQDIIAQFGENSDCHRAYYELTSTGAPIVAIVPLPQDAVFVQADATITSASYVAQGGQLKRDGETTNDGIFWAAVAAAEQIRTDILVLYGRGSDATTWNNAATPATPADDYPPNYFYADNNANYVNSWVSKLAKACNDVTLNSHPMLGVIGVKGLSGLENPTPTEIKNGLALPNLVLKDSIGPPNTNAKSGHLVSVIAAEVHILGAPLSWGWQNGACSYASSVARLESYSATTGKPVYNVDRLRYNPTRTTLEILTGDKYVVPAALDFQRIPRWVDGTTFALKDSDYNRLTTVRIVFDAVQLIRRVAQNYVGEAMSIDKQQAFNTQISSALQSMQKVGAINNSDFRVSYSPKDSKAIIDLALTPAFELREVIIQVAVNF